VKEIKNKKSNINTKIILTMIRILKKNQIIFVTKEEIVYSHKE